MSLPSSIVDDLVNIALPIENMFRITHFAPQEYTASSTTLSQILGRTASYLSQSTISLQILIHYLGELQDWSDTIPNAFRQSYTLPSSLPETNFRAINFLNLRWLDAIIVATKPFLASQARFGISKPPLHQRNFFTFCATVASRAARETLSLMRHMEIKQQIKGLTAFDRHFLVQSATVFALSSVVQVCQRGERLRFRECIEMLLRIPGARHGSLIRSMCAVESKLERFEVMKGSRLSYVLVPTSHGLL